MLKLTVLSPERKVAEAIDVQSVSLTTSEGAIQILPDHADMIGILQVGPFSYALASGEEKRGVISHGFFEIVHGAVKVIADTLEFAQEIDLPRAKSAQRKAESALLDTEADFDPRTLRKYQLKLERALIRQQVAGKPHADL